MNYHDTVPTQPGDYRNRTGFTFQRAEGRWWAQGQLASDELIKSQLPLIGPLPTTQDEAIALACEVAFARMQCAQACDMRPLLQQKRSHDVANALALKFCLQGERSLSLLREMERVTGELIKSTKE